MLTEHLATKLKALATLGTNPANRTEYRQDLAGLPDEELNVALALREIGVDGETDNFELYIKDLGQPDPHLNKATHLAGKGDIGASEILDGLKLLGY